MFVAPVGIGIVNPTPCSVVFENVRTVIALFVASAIVAARAFTVQSALFGESKLVGTYVIVRSVSVENVSKPDVPVIDIPAPLVNAGTIVFQFVDVSAINDAGPVLVGMV